MLLLLALASCMSCVSGVASCADPDSARAKASAAAQRATTFIKTLHSQNQSEGSCGRATAFIAPTAQYDRREGVLDSEDGYCGVGRLWRRSVREKWLANAGDRKRYLRHWHDFNHYGLRKTLALLDHC